MNMTSHHATVDTTMHRATVMALDGDSFCAQEGLFADPRVPGRKVSCPPRARRSRVWDGDHDFSFSGLGLNLFLLALGAVIACGIVGKVLFEISRWWAKQ